MSIVTPNQAPSSNENNTSEQAIVVTPTASETRDSIHPDRKKSILEKLDTPVKQILAFLAIAGVAGGAGVGGLKVVEGMADNSHSSDKQSNATGPTIAGQEVTNQPTVEAHPSVSPSNLGPLETAAPTQETDPATQYELKAGQTPEAVAKNLFEKVLPEWDMAGTNKTMVDKVTQYVMANGKTKLGDYYKELAQQNTPAFKKGLFGDTPAPEITKVVNDFENINTFVLDMYYRTSDDNEPYKTWNSVESVQVLAETASTRQLQIQLTEHDNATTGVNSALKYMGTEGSFEGKKRTIIVSLKTVGDKEIVTSFQ
jgi:hypothetical protein